MFRLLVAIGFKEIEVGFPVRVADRLRFRAPADRGGPDPRRRHDPGADPGARGADPAHVRIAARARSAPSCTSTTPTSPLFSARRVRHGPRRASSTSPSTARRLIQRVRGRAAGDRLALRILARDASPHRARLRPRDLRRGRPTSGSRRRATTGDPQPAGDGRGGHAQRLSPTRSSGCTATCRAPRCIVLGPSAQRSRHRRRGRRARASWRAPTASKAACSATASAPATSAS